MNRTPSKFIREKMWQRLFPWDQKQASQARKALVKLNLYPTQKISAEAAFDGEEANYRAALHEIVDTLTREDLRAVYQLARLLALTPEGVDEAVASQARAGEFFLAAMQMNPRDKTVLAATMQALQGVPA